MKNRKIMKTIKMFKKIILLLCLPIVLFAGSDQGRSLKCGVGNTNKGCTGAGICMSNGTGAQATEFSFNMDDIGLLTIKINKEELAINQPEAFEKLMESEFYLIEEVVELPSELCLALKVENNFKIQAGNYPMTDNGKEFVISIVANDDGLR